MYFYIVTLVSCEPPHKYSVAGTFGNTYINNDYCVDNPSLLQSYGVLFFLAYLTVDLYLCLFLIKDTSSGMLQNYVHHALGICGTVAGILCGRMILTLSCATLLTEFSTPFVSLRALLSIHKKTSTTLYLVNGLLMTLSFFVCRVLFQPWLVSTKLWPAVYYRSEMMADTN